MNKTGDAVNDADQYNPYCEVCQSCGETGCCSSTICTQGQGCKYPKTHLMDLKYVYTQHRRLIDYIYKNEEKYKDIIVELNKIENEEYDKWYN